MQFQPFSLSSFYSVYGIGICSLWETIFYIVSCILCAGDDRQCGCDRGIYGIGRVFCGEYYGPDPKHCDDRRTDLRRIIRRVQWGEQMWCLPKQASCQVICR